MAAKIRLRVEFKPGEEQQARSTAAPAADPAVSQATPGLSEPGASQPRPREPGARQPGPSEPAVEVQVYGARHSGSRHVSRAEARQLAGSFGEPFRAIETFPGVTPTLSGAPYFYVRGSPPSNFGYFLDDIRLPALFHVLAGPSVVHPGLVESVDFYPGPYPARYGGFAGGIAAGELRAPTDSAHGELNLRAFDSSALLEIPVLPQTSLTLAGRYSYANPIARLFAPEISVSYWDYQGRLSTALTSRDQLTLFVFGSRDQLDEEGAQGTRRIFGSEFHRVDLGLRHALDAGTVRVRSVLGWDRSDREDGKVQLTDLSTRWRLDLEQHLSETLVFESGLEAGHDRYELELEQLAAGETRDEFRERFPGRVDSVLGVYGAFGWQATRGIYVEPGLRTDLYRSLSKLSVGISPRVSAEIALADNLTAEYGLGIARQPPAEPLPAPANTPALAGGLQTAYQSSAGLHYRVPDFVELSATLFQSVLVNLSDDPGISRIDNADDSSDERSRVLGSSRGLEFLVSRSFARRLGGYVSYTLSSSRRSVGRAEGPSLFDRRHVLSGAVGYRFDAGYRLGGRASFYTGIPADVAYLEAARDPPRTPAFYRIDVRAEKRWALGKPGTYWALVLEVLNATLHEEVLEMSCSAHVCRSEAVGPITIPSLGIELVF